MTTVCEREAAVSRIIVRKPKVRQEAADSLLHTVITLTGVAIFYGVIFGLCSWNVYRVITQVLR